MIDMKKSLLLLCISFLMINSLIAQSHDIIKDNLSSIFSTAGLQYQSLLDSANLKMKYPRSSKEGKITYVGIEDWTGGFWPGALWYMFDYTKNNKWKTAAIKWTETIEKNLVKCRWFWRKCGECFVEFVSYLVE